MTLRKRYLQSRETIESICLLPQRLVLVPQIYYGVQISYGDRIELKHKSRDIDLIKTDSKRRITRLANICYFRIHKYLENVILPFNYNFECKHAKSICAVVMTISSSGARNGQKHPGPDNHLWDN